MLLAETFQDDAALGSVFVPAEDTRPGFTLRPITGSRQVTYVKPEWRSRHELAFQDQPARGV